MKFLLGLILGLLLFPIAAILYFHHGHPPVAVADKGLFFEEKMVHVPLHNRIDSEMQKTAPIEASATNLEAGSHIYRQQCAVCHGLYGRPAAFAAHMYPRAPQLWAPHSNGVVGVSDDPPGETFWKVSNGIRLTGMPAFNKVLSPVQMWQVTLLLAGADKPLPPGVLDLLKKPLDLDPVAQEPQPSLPGSPEKITDLPMPSPLPPDQP